MTDVATWLATYEAQHTVKTASTISDSTAIMVAAITVVVSVIAIVVAKKIIDKYLI